MRDVAEYRERAEDCRQQALKLATQSDRVRAFSGDGANLGTTRGPVRTEREAQSVRRAIDEARR